MQLVQNRLSAIKTRIQTDLRFLDLGVVIYLHSLPTVESLFDLVEKANKRHVFTRIAD